MGLFGTLMQKIFHAGANAEAPPDAIKRGMSNESRVSAAERAGVPVGAPIPAGMNPAAPAAPQGPIDIAWRSAGSSRPICTTPATRKTRQR